MTLAAEDVAAGVHPGRFELDVPARDAGRPEPAAPARESEPATPVADHDAARRADAGVRSLCLFVLLRCVAVLRCDPALDAITKKARGDQKTGVDIVRRALRAPIKQIAENAGLDGSIVCQKVSEDSGNFGYNALTEEYGDMIKMGVIVPLKVERIALQNAASVAGLLLTTDAVVSEIKEKEEEKAGAGHMH